MPLREERDLQGHPVQEVANIFYAGQIVKILDFAGHMVSVTPLYSAAVT